MNPYAVNIMTYTSTTTHISLLHASLVAQIEDLLSRFHSIMARTRSLLWSLPIVAHWVKFRTWYHDFMTMRAPVQMNLDSYFRAFGLSLWPNCYVERSLSRGGLLWRPCSTHFLYTLYLPYLHHLHLLKDHHHMHRMLLVTQQPSLIRI